MRIPLALAALVFGGIVPLAAAQLTAFERGHLLAHMEMTSGWLADEVTGLSEAQATFRPAATAWNILEVVEHLVVVGPIYWNDLQKSLQAPAPKRSLAAGDADILWYGIDRTRRETAIPPERPPGRLRDLEAGMDAYRMQHAKLVDYIRTTKDDLRAHVVERQACDAYQWALLISTHEQRHVLQIREIKAHSGYPKR
jgi:DinB family protein